MVAGGGGCKVRGISHGDWLFSDQQIDFLLGKFWVKVLHLKNIFVNFRRDAGNIFTRFSITMDYSDT